MNERIIKITITLRIPLPPTSGAATAQPEEQERPDST